MLEKNEMIFGVRAVIEAIQAGSCLLYTSDAADE